MANEQLKHGTGLELRRLGERLRSNLQNFHDTAAFLQRFGCDAQRKFEEGKELVANNFGKLLAIPSNKPNPSSFASLTMAADKGEPHWEAKHVFDVALSQAQVSKTLEGVSVYTASNARNEFVLVSDATGHKSLGLFCFRKQDAEALLSQVTDREPALARGARVVSVSLDQVYKLSTEGIAFRFLPDPLQLKNAIQARTKSGSGGKAFDGVPVFQAENLILRRSTRRFIPVFFCKEDLERALVRALKQQKKTSSSLQASSEIQVGSFEDVLRKMESQDESSGWEDIIFVPPGKDAIEHLGRAMG